MERNEDEAAPHDAQAALLPGVGDDGAAPAELAQMRGMLDRLARENLELRRRLAIEEAAQASAAARLDAAYLRIYELSEEALAAQRLAAAVEREFDNFRTAYARIVDTADSNEFALRRVLEDAQRQAALRPARAAAPPVMRLLSTARLGPGPGTPLPSGSGRLPAIDPGTA